MKIVLSIVVAFFYVQVSAQNDSVPIFKNAIKANKDKLYQNLINKSINKNLSLPLADSTEDRWINAFWSMEILQYKTTWTTSRISSAFEGIERRSPEFQRALLELVYGNYPRDYIKSVTSLMYKTTDEKIFALCAEYMLHSGLVIQKFLYQQINASKQFKSDEKKGNFIYLLTQRVKPTQRIDGKQILPTLVSSQYLPKNVIVYSFQRKDRDCPGIAIVRDTAGNFIKDKAGNIFSVPQLARSKSALPYYLTNGNTPQGIYRMDGFDVSRSSYIGPTENIQLMMPCETTLQHFFNDSTIVDSLWTLDWYKKILPINLSSNFQLLESYYASAIGRTEIIAHGTTVNPEYYIGKSYYPQTPTEGCLSTIESWSELNGKRMLSDQQKLVDAVKIAGGANGYYIVIEIDDKQEPVTLEDVLYLLK